jgi:hypothetical protein
MSAPSVTAARWSLVDRIAASPGGGRLDLDAPGLGIALADGRDRVLGVDLRTPCAVGEHWLRGEDVIATYEPADPRRLRATAMWRLHPTARTAPETAWELTLSAQTALVQSDALLAVTCDLAGVDVRCRTAAGDWSPVAVGGQPPDDATCLLVRRQAAATVLVAVHPSDARPISLAWREGRVGVACWLFSAAIEKGVLVRGRVLAAVGTPTRDETWADELCASFAAAPPPLTA